MIVNSSQGGGFKDTWVLGGNTPSTAKDVAPALASLARFRHRPVSPVTASKADNFFWLGRYTERVYTTLEQFFPFYDRVMDTDVDAFRPFAKALDLPQDFKDFDAFIDSFLYDESVQDSIRSSMGSAFRNAVILRPELSSRLLQHVELALTTTITGSHEHGTAAEGIYRQRDVNDHLLAFWGGIEDSAADITFKSVIFIGKYIERLDLYTRFGSSPEDLAGPLRKLAASISTLDSQPMPLCVVDGLVWLVNQLPLRGYDEAAARLRTMLEGCRTHMASSDSTSAGMLSSMSMNLDGRRDDPTNDPVEDPTNDPVKGSATV
jgi:hypothetical protein